MPLEIGCGTRTFGGSSLRRKELVMVVWASWMGGVSGMSKEEKTPGADQGLDGE